MHFLVHFFVSLLSLLLTKGQITLCTLDLEVDVCTWSVHLKGLLKNFLNLKIHVYFPYLDKRDIRGS